MTPVRLDSLPNRVAAAIRALIEADRAAKEKAAAREETAPAVEKPEAVKEDRRVRVDHPTAA